MSCKILMFGDTGQIATEVKRASAADSEIILTALGRGRADLASPEACAAAIDAADADVVLNAAAHTAVDKAEEQQDLANRVNGESPGAMARACAARSMPFLHISTDYVFDGAAGPAWTETAPVAPLSAYGRSKLAGEQAVLAAGGAPVVLRTAWVHSAHGGNFVKTMLRAGATRDKLTVIDDQKGGPTAAHDIAAALLTIARAFKSGRGEPGVYHYCGAPAVSWRGFADEIFRQASWINAPEVAPIRTEDWPTPAARPKNSVLDCRKIHRIYGIAQPDWRISLAAILRELKETAK